MKNSLIDTITTNMKKIEIYVELEKSLNLISKECEDKDLLMKINESLNFITNEIDLFANEIINIVEISNYNNELIIELKNIINTNEIYCL